MSKSTHERYEELQVKQMEAIIAQNEQDAERAREYKESYERTYGGRSNGSDREVSDRD